MDWFPVPSLQFQSAMKVTTHVFSRPSVVGRKAWCPARRLKRKHEKLKEEIIATLPLPLPLRKYMLTLTHSVLRQLNNFYKTVVEFLFEAVPYKFPLKTKDETLLYVCWNNEGCIDLERTMNLLRSIVDGNGVPLSRHRYKDFALTCSYLLDAPIHYIWQIELHEDYDEIQADALSCCLGDYELYQHEKISCLKNEDFCMNAVKTCIYKKNLPGLRICWPHLPLHCKKQILRQLLDQSYDTIFRMSDDVTNAEIARFCLLQCGESEPMAVILRHMSKSSCWISLLWMFWLWPEKSVFLNILKLMFDCLSKTEFTSQLLTLFENDRFGSYFNNFFKDVWENSPRAYKMELLREEQILISILNLNDDYGTANVAMILQSYTPDEKRPFLQQHVFKLCAPLFVKNEQWKDIIFQEYDACQIDIKAITKEIMMSNPPFEWIMSIGLWPQLEIWIKWCGLSSEKEIQLRKHMEEYISRKERLR